MDSSRNGESDEWLEWLVVGTGSVCAGNVLGMEEVFNVKDRDR